MIKLSHYRVLLFVFSMSINSFAGKGDKRAVDGKTLSQKKAKKKRESSSYFALLRSALYDSDAEALREILAHHRERFLARMSFENWGRLSRRVALREESDNTAEEDGWNALCEAASNDRFQFLRLALGYIARALVIENPSGGNIAGLLARRESGLRTALSRRVRLSEQERARLFQRDAHGTNVMEAAVAANSIDSINVLFEFAREYPELLEPDEFGRSALSVTILDPDSSLEAVHAILARRDQFPQLLRVDLAGASPLHHVVAADRIIVAQELMALVARYPHLRLPMNDGSTLLTTAAFGAISNEHTGTLEWLCEEAALHPWILDAQADGTTVLHRVAVAPEGEELRITLDSGEEIPAVEGVLRCLLDNALSRPELLLPNRRGETALYLAALHGHGQTVSTLLDYAVRGGPYLRLLARTDGLETALDAAATWGRVEGVERVLGYADRLPVLLSNIALGHAVRHGHIDVVLSLLRHAERFPVLVERPQDGETALHTAVNFRNMNMIRLLMGSVHVAALMGTPYIENWRFIHPPVGFRQIWLTMLPFMPGLIASLDRPAFRARFPELLDVGRIEAAVVLGDLAHLALFLNRFADQFDETLLVEMLEQLDFPPGWRFALTRAVWEQREKIRQMLTHYLAVQVFDRIIAIIGGYSVGHATVFMTVPHDPVIPTPLRINLPIAKLPN